MCIQDINRREIEGAYLLDRIVEYVKRIGPNAKVQMIEVPDDKAPESMSPAEAYEGEQSAGLRDLRLAGAIERAAETPKTLQKS